MKMERMQYMNKATVLVTAIYFIEVCTEFKILVKIV